MSEKYEQMELDTRPLLQAAIEGLTQSAITDTGQLIKEHHRQVAQETMTAPPYVRNRHEAYGIAAEQLAKITSAVKSIKDDTASLLGTLADPNFNAVDATSSIVNSTVNAAYVMLVAAAEMRRTLDNLYTVENTGRDETTPLRSWPRPHSKKLNPPMPANMKWRNKLWQTRRTAPPWPRWTVSPSPTATKASTRNSWPS